MITLQQHMSGIFVGFQNTLVHHLSLTFWHSSIYIIFKNIRPNSIMPPKYHHKVQSMQSSQITNFISQRTPHSLQKGQLTSQQQQFIQQLVKSKSQDLSNLVKGLVSPKNRGLLIKQSSKQNLSKQPSSSQLNHIKTQPPKLTKVHTKSDFDIVRNKSPQSTKSSVLNQDRNPLKRSGQELTIILNYKQLRKKYNLDVTVNKIRWLVDYLRSEIKKVDESIDARRIVSFKTVFGTVPLDYILSQVELPLQTLAQFPKQPIVVEPIMDTERKTVDGSRLGLKDFDFMRCIGMGGFSKVYLVREKATGNYYALKLIEKESIVEQKKEMIIQNERDIMVRLKHPFIVRLHASFESRSYLAFVLEYCSGGELFYLLRKVKRMSEQEAFFYFCEICLGMKHLHDRDIVYRDIKPENILIDLDGHVRIADFGLSKPGMGEGDVAHSFCGSPEYMAPEMLLKAGHSFQLDLYCLGALLYELVTGLPPFYSRNKDEIYERIIHQKLTFPQSVPLSVTLKDLLTSLLAKNPHSRIHSIDMVLKHPWMTQWGDVSLMHEIEKKHIDPPFRPDIFRFNFDEEEFGQGEGQFLLDIAQQQHNVMENYPRDVLLKGFYYHHQAHTTLKYESTGGTSVLHLPLDDDKDSNDFSNQLSHRSQRKHNPKHTRMNTLDDCITPHQPKNHTITHAKQTFLLNQLRLYTNQETAIQKAAKRNSQQY